MRRFMTTVLLCAALLMLCVGCKGESEDKSDKAGEAAGDNAAGEGKPGETPKNGAPKAAAGATLKLSPATYEKDGLKMTYQAPEGWKSGDFGDSLMYQGTTGIFPSNLIVGPTCEGDCSKLKENVAGMIESQRAMHDKAKYSPKILRQSDEGGRWLAEYELKRGDKTLRHLIVARYEDGWKHIAKCSVQANNKAETDAWDDLKKACEGFEAVPAPAAAP